MIPENTMSPKLFEKILSTSAVDVCVIRVGHVKLGIKEFGGQHVKKIHSLSFHQFSFFSRLMLKSPDKIIFYL